MRLLNDRSYSLLHFATPSSLNYVIGNKLFSRLFPYPQYMVCTEERGHAASPGAAECPWHYTRCVGLCFAYHLCGLTLWMCMFYGVDPFSLSLVPVARPLSHTIREVSLWKRRRALHTVHRVFLCLCKRHWINRVPGAHQGDSLCIPFTLTLTLAMPSYL